MRCPASQRGEMQDLVTIFRGHICDVSPTTVTLEIQGKEKKMRALQEILEPYGELPGSNDSGNGFGSPTASALHNPAASVFTCASGQHSLHSSPASASRWRNLGQSLYRVLRQSLVAQVSWRWLARDARRLRATQASTPSTWSSDGQLSCRLQTLSNEPELLSNTCCKCLKL